MIVVNQAQHSLSRVANKLFIMLPEDYLPTIVTHTNLWPLFVTRPLRPFRDVGQCIRNKHESRHAAQFIADSVRSMWRFMRVLHVVSLTFIQRVRLRLKLYESTMSVIKI